LIERVSGKPRRETTLSRGTAADAIARSKPVAWWRLDEFHGPHAVDASGHDRDAVYERGVTYYLAGPRSKSFCSDGQVNRAAMFVGGRLRSRIGQLGDRYSVSLWLWNGMPNTGRAVSGWLFSRGRDNGLARHSDHLGIGGTSGHTGRLIFMRGRDASSIISGQTEIPRWQWQHVVFVRDRQQVQVYLNGELEIESTVAGDFPPGFDRLFFGGRSDNESNWEGRLDEISVFDRPLQAGEVSTLWGQ
ncbi:MAG: LamG domain-containing protein, partial [Planctomycetaceae bacterium]